MSIHEVINGSDFAQAVEFAFFKGMMNGYATESSLKRKIAELPGSKHIVSKCGMFLITDTYLVTPVSGRSGGTTVISFEDIPVWMMQYLGTYSESAIPILKVALLANYERNIFLGGRGPEVFFADGLRYTNQPKIGSSFKEFSGEERICDGDYKCLGYHHYQGLLMIGP